jgi:hypothetical protein
MGHERAKHDLQHDLRHEQPGLDHVDAALRRIDLPVIHVERIDVITLDPGAEVERLVGYVVFELARLHAVTAADALLGVVRTEKDSFVRLDRAELERIAAE